MTRPEPVWFYDPPTRLTVATQPPRQCVSCQQPIEHESCMSTVDGWIHIRCHNAERAEYERLDPEHSEPEPKRPVAVDEQTECQF